MTKTTTFFALFLILALGVASAASSYSVKLFQPSTVAGKELQAGDYKLTLDNDKATIMKGKEKVEATVKVETSEAKFPTTSVRYTDMNGKMKIQEIRLGGTNTKLVFN